MDDRAGIADKDDAPEWPAAAWDRAEIAVGGKIVRTATGTLTLIQCERVPDCQHDFQGWREFDDGLGGETVCTKCGLGAMAFTLSMDI